jgi:hypothetical protein
MQCSVVVSVELDPEGGVEDWEPMIQAAGWAAMRQLLAHAVRVYEEQQASCPHCGEVGSQSQGTVRRCLRTVFGRVVLPLRRQRCGGCGRRFRPAQGCLAALGPAQVTPPLARAAALAGASWPYATAARVLHQLSGAQVSVEQVRRLTTQHGAQQAQTQEAEAARVLQPTAAEVRAERAAQEHAPRRTATAPAPSCLLVGLDGGWVPSREQEGGMEGKVGVVATGSQPVGKQGRHRLCPRRYVATFGSSDHVGTLAAAAAVALGGYEAPEQVVLGDGAAWIKTQAAEQFPEAVGILDWAHVERAVHQAIRAACPGAAHRARRRELHQQIPDLLWQGEVEAALAALAVLRPPAPAEPVGRLEQTLRYLAGQRGWLGNYAAWQEQGYPIGSGLIERAVALVINWRMKKRGMRWCRSNASALVALRVRELNAAWQTSQTDWRCSA